MEPGDERHGSYAGYMQHVKSGDLPACGPCREAATAYAAERRSDPRQREADRWRSRWKNRAITRLIAAHRQEFATYQAEEEVRDPLPARLVRDRRLHR